MSKTRWGRKEISNILDKKSILEQMQKYRENGYVNGKCGKSRGRYFYYKEEKYPLKYIICRALDSKVDFLQN